MRPTITVAQLSLSVTLHALVRVDEWSMAPVCNARILSPRPCRASRRKLRGYHDDRRPALGGGRGGNKGGGLEEAWGGRGPGGPRVGNCRGRASAPRTGPAHRRPRGRPPAGAGASDGDDDCDELSAHARVTAVREAASSTKDEKKDAGTWVLAHDGPAARGRLADRAASQRHRQL